MAFFKRLTGFCLISILSAAFILSGTITSTRAAQPSLPLDSPSAIEIAQAPVEEFVLPPLPYAYDALEPYIDQQTMVLHHDKHHAGYVKNLNEAIANYPDLQDQSVETLLQNIESLPEAIRNTVRNNGGGHANHTLFWESMTPDASGMPSGAIAQAITDQFGDFAAFQEAFNTTGKDQFGSGWAWLVLNSEGELEVTSTANQDSPIMSGAQPLLGNDVWEHAYYLSYQNKRGDYLNAWWNTVNWDVVNERYEEAIATAE